MVATRRTIKITAESRVDEILADAATSPLILDSNGVRYRLSREGRSDIWEGYQPDPDETLKMLDEVAGSWGDLDIDKMIFDLYEAREKGSRPANRS